MKSPFNFTITYENDEVINLHEKDIWVEFFLIHSVGFNTNTNNVEMMNKTIYLGDEIKTRQLDVSLQLFGVDFTDYELLRNELFAIFRPNEKMLIKRDAEPHKVIECYLSSSYSLDYVTCQDGEVTIPLIMYQPFIKSIATTQELHDQLLYSDEKWSYGMGLLHDDESHIYTHTALEFSIYNAGNVAIHPFEQDLLITIANAAKNYELKNLTTGDTFKYTGDMQGTLKIDGPNITLNSLQVFRDTNKKHITLAPGWNHFKQNQNREVSFDFRYYYL